MPGPATIRPLRAEDVPDADTAASAALDALPGGVSHGEASEARRARGIRRIEHLLATDPGGCWVAEVDGQVVGTALGLVRDGVWGFSLFGILPGHQGRGIGTELLAAALTHAEGTRGGIILSSSHPAAMRRYARAGFDLHPCVSLAGAWDPRRMPAGRRSRAGDPGADAATIDRASRHVRGASHAPDLPTLLANPGMALLVCEDRGFACVREGGTPALLAAVDEEAATDLLLSSFAHGPRGGSVTVEHLTAGQQWAIRAGLEVGLSLSPEGPVFLRGETGPFAPYVPSGAYL